MNVVICLKAKKILFIMCDMREVLKMIEDLILTVE